jgi:hypothetical protein
MKNVPESVKPSLSKFDESLASKYFVTGKRGEPKVIALDRNLVKFELIN